MDDKKPALSKDEIHESLTNTSVDLHYVFWNVPRDVQIQRLDPNSWSPLEILIHLRQVGDVYTQRVKRIVEHEDAENPPFLHDFDEKKQIRKINLEDETVKHNLGQFMQSRSKLLNIISFLEEEKWEDLKCIHEKSGNINLRQLLTPLVYRERKHLKRIKELLGREN